MILLKKATFILSLLIITSITFYSCNEGDDIEDYEVQNKYNNESNLEQSNSENRMTCDLNLTNNGCEFTSGEGKVAASYNTMINLLDNCYTESLASNCNWFGNYEQTKTMSRNFIISQCNSASIMNFYLNDYENWAKAIRPNSSYIITGYQLQTATNTGDGYFRLKIRVIYRKKICSLSGNPSQFNTGG